MRKTWADIEEECRIWKEYRDMIKPIVDGLKRRKSLEDQQTGLNILTDTMEKKWSKEEKESAPIVKQSGVAKLVKPAKVPTWSKSMSLEVYTRQLTIWQISNVEVPGSTQFQDLVESPKVKKKIKS